jgi:hypothetical protein
MTPKLRRRAIGAALAEAFQGRFAMGANLRTKYYDTERVTIIIINGVSFAVCDREVELNDPDRLADLIAVRYAAALIIRDEAVPDAVAGEALPADSERPGRESGVPALGPRRSDQLEDLS